MSNKILAVVLNWRRPFNLKFVIESLRAQSVPLKIAVVECSPGTQYAADQGTLGRADIVFSVNQNCGPCSRFIPPLMLPEHRYTFFAVDDHVPGPRHVECLLRTAESLGTDRFASIGQDGRVISDDGKIIKRRARLDPAGPKAVDFITSSELVETRWVGRAMLWRDRLLEDHSDPSMLFEDDLILCMGSQREIAAAAPCYLTPKPASDDEWWAVRKLPAPHALCARADHHEKRELFVRRAIESGWMSQVPQSPQSQETQPAEGE